MNYKLLFAIVLSTMLLSCQSDTELHKVMDENGKLVEEYTRSTKDYSKQGIHKRFYPDGGPIMEITTYVDDVVDGEFIRFYENGDTLTVAKMKKGIYHGYFREYYPENKLMQSYQHKDGKISGRFLTYFESGVLKEEVYFKDNFEDGPFVEYHETGKKSFEGIYYKGKERGELLKYDEAGELIRKMDCEIIEQSGIVSNICTTTWQKKGTEDK